MKDNSRIGIILNGSPLFTGGAGSGKSEIRLFMLAKDLLDAIVALPTDMFYNTGIATYIWVLSNHKLKECKGKVLLINATEKFAPMRKSLGSKRKELTEAQIDKIVISIHAINLRLMLSCLRPLTLAIAVLSLRSCSSLSIASR